MPETLSIFGNRRLDAPQNGAVIPLHKPDAEEQFFFLSAGIIMSIPMTVLAEQLSTGLAIVNLSTFYAMVLSIAVIAPLIEEFAKAYPLFYRHGETERSIVTLGFLTGLGFGLVEFFLYVFVLSAPILLRLPELVFHATNTAIVAYGVAIKKPLPFYLMAVFLHFLINFLGLFDLFWFLGFAIAIPASYFLALQLYNKSREVIVI